MVFGSCGYLRTKKDEIHQGFSQVQMQFNAVLFSSAAFEENVHPGLTVII